jgi:phage-related protein
MATFTWVPDYEAVEVSRPRVRKTQLGSGYEQRVTFGLNSNLKEWQLSFSERTDTEREQIMSFLNARNATESFDWTPPRGTAGKYVCEEWQTTLRRCNLNTIRATFRQVPN